MTDFKTLVEALSGGGVEFVIAGGNRGWLS
jgi:hypothetical protein